MGTTGTGHEDGETGGTIGNTLPEEGNDTTQVRCIQRDFPGAYMGVSRPLKHQTVYGPTAWMGSLVQDAQDASGLMYHRDRYYDPQTGKFTQEDPIGLAGGINAYGFANGDPVGYSDPYGLRADSAKVIEVIFWHLVGPGESSFGHVSVNVDGTSYSFGPNGMDVRPTKEYLARQGFRDGIGIVLNLTPEGKNKVQNTLQTYQEVQLRYEQLW